MRNYRDYKVDLVRKGGEWFIGAVSHYGSGARLPRSDIGFGSENQAFAHAKGLIDSFLYASAAMSAPAAG